MPERVESEWSIVATVDFPVIPTLPRYEDQREGLLKPARSEVCKCAASLAVAYALRRESKVDSRVVLHKPRSIADDRCDDVSPGGCSVGLCT